MTNGQSSSTPRETWSQRFIGFGFAIALVIVGVILQQYWSPRPGLEANGLFVDFAMPPPEAPALPAIVPIRSYWKITVKNSGTKTADAVRLYIPKTDILSIAGNILKAAAGHIHETAVLGSLEVAQSVVVEGWSHFETTASPDPDKFILTHSEGYGTVDLSRVISEGDRSWLITGSIAQTGFAVLALAVLVWMTIADRKTHRELRRLIEAERMRPNPPPQT